MIQFEVGDLIIQVSRNNIHIIDSFKITSKNEIKKYVVEILDRTPIFHTKRSVNSFVREWYAHNKFYRMGLFKSHTKDCDLGRFLFPWSWFFYFIFGF